MNNNTSFNGKYEKNEKPRFKNIKKPFKNPEINQDDVNKKFDIVKSHGADLLDKDDIKVSKDK